MRSKKKKSKTPKPFNPFAHALNTNPLYKSKTITDKRKSSDKKHARKKVIDLENP